MRTSNSCRVYCFSETRNDFLKYCVLFYVEMLQGTFVDLNFMLCTLMHFVSWKNVMFSSFLNFFQKMEKCCNVLYLVFVVTIISNDIFSFVEFLRFQLDWISISDSVLCLKTLSSLNLNCSCCRNLRAFAPDLSPRRIDNFHLPLQRSIGFLSSL